MEIKTVKKARNRIIWIILLSILCLILISFLPWISIEENDFVKGNLHLNYEMMKGSSNTDIFILSKSLSNINILFWILVLITLISFILLISYLLVKKLKIIEILNLIISFLIFSLLIFIIYFQIMFSRSIDEIDYITASMIHYPFAYPYIEFIFSIILLIFSGLYSLNLTTDFIKQYKKQPLQKNGDVKEIEEQKLPDINIEEKLRDKLKESENIKTTINSDMDLKIAEIDELLEKKEIVKNNDNFDEKPPEQERDIAIKIEPTSDKTDIEDKVEEREINDKKNENELEEKDILKDPFPHKEKKEKIEESDEIRQSEHFEKALSSAIERKQSDMKLKKSEKKDEKNNNKVEANNGNSIVVFQTEKIQLEKKGNKINKIFSLKCPGCNQIFPYNKEKNTQKITCPNCGKKGKTEKEI